MPCGETFPQKEVITVLTMFVVTVAADVTAGIILYFVYKKLEGRK